MALDKAIKSGNGVRKTENINTSKMRKKCLTS